MALPRADIRGMTGAAQASSEDMGMALAGAGLPWTRGNRLVGYDPVRRRVWVGGQRLHHGATGCLLGAGVLVGLGAQRFERRPALAYTLAATAMCAHDWKDWRVWFRFGPQAD